MVILMALAAVLALPGCLTREEQVLVRPDGSVRATVSLEGDELDYRTGDPLAAPAGWSATEETEVASDGRRTIKAVWTAEMPGLDHYPRSFGPPGEEGSLRMATSLTREEHTDRTVYRFTRVYSGRRAGVFDRLRASQVPAELQARAEKDPDSLTPEEREELFRGLASYESAALLLRARNTLGRAVQDGALDPAAFEPALESLRALLDDRLSGDALRRFFLLPDDEQGPLWDRLRQDVRRIVEAAAEPVSRHVLKSILDREERHFEISQDLTDDYFRLSVRLPGIIVETSTPEAQGGEATWEFEGRDLMEGDFVLTAVSVAAK
jgi:hypothetical protein